MTEMSKSSYQKPEEFIGEIFGENGNLTVIDVLPKEPYHIQMFNVECSICKQDPEMWGNGVFTSSKQNLKSGRMPCGCVPAKILTEKQWVIKITRKCKKLGYVFLGFVEDNVKIGVNKKVKLHCLHDGNEWCTTNLRHLMAGHGCSRCTVYGFDGSRPSFFYVMRISKEGEDGFTGYGITRNFKDRVRHHKKHLKDAGFSIQDYKLFEIHGRIATKIEQDVNRNFINNRQEITGFKKEATSYDKYDAVISFVSGRIEKYSAIEKDSLDSADLKHAWNLPINTSSLSQTYSEITTPFS